MRQLANLAPPEGSTFAGAEVRRLVGVVRSKVGSRGGLDEKFAALLHVARSPAFLDAN